MRTTALLLLTSSLALLACACTKRHEQIKTYVGEYEVLRYEGGYMNPDGTWVPSNNVIYPGYIEKVSYRKLKFHCDCSEEDYIISLDRDGNFTHKKGDYEGKFYNIDDTLLIVTDHYQGNYSLGGFNMWFIKK